MRRHLTFTCHGSTLWATLDLPVIPAKAALLIVSGGNEIRAGAHRGMAELAARLAGHGFAVLRFDRRGIGDSEGANSGFNGSRDDIIAAAEALTAACPTAMRLVGFGNCDAATALLLHQPLPVDTFVLANPWTIEPAATGDDTMVPELPPAAAIRARYWARLKDPANWVRLLRGEVDLGKLRRGIGAMGRKAQSPKDCLGSRVASALSGVDRPAVVLIATGDRTAQSFAGHWKGNSSPNVRLIARATASHSFAGDDAGWLADQLVDVLGAA